jgi:DNA-binding beta-propeller fold protein YncE
MRAAGLIRVKRLVLAVGCAILSLGALAGPAWGAVSDPLFVFVPVPPPPPAQVSPPPTGYLNGPCGLAVDGSARFYVSDYYHHVIDVFSSAPSYSNQLTNEDPTDGPCGLALDPANRLYVNNYHRNVVRYNASPSFGAGAVIAGAGVDGAYPTGVAVDPLTGIVYVNDRTYIAAYDSSGAPIMDGLEPLKIGLGTLGDSYGLAVSAFPGTAGHLYVPDAATNTVKVFDPATSKTTPVATIENPFSQPFVSLRDSAVAVDRVTGDVYFADNLQPALTEKPQAEIYVYSSTNSYKGHLKYEVADALPPGLAVDNSAGLTQGRVYVTSGNTSQAGVYAYRPGAATSATPLPPTVSLALAAAGPGSGAISASSPVAIECVTACEEQIHSGAEVTLGAIPDPGSSFEGWSGGGCGGTGTCTVAMDEATAVSARFARPGGADVPQPSGPTSTSAPVVTRSAVPVPRRCRHRAAKGHRRCIGHRHHRTSAHHRVN